MKKILFQPFSMVILSLTLIACSNSDENEIKLIRCDEGSQNKSSNSLIEF